MGLALAAIVLTMAVPSFTTTIKNNKVVTHTNDLIADMNFARSEAVKRGTRVILCRSAAPNAATPVCGGNANDWSDGWLVFASGDTDDDYDAADDILLRIGDPSDNTVDIKSNSTANQDVVYNADGTTNEGGNTAVFAVCDSRGSEHGRQIQINAAGRPRLVSPVPVSCSNPSV